MKYVNRIVYIDVAACDTLEDTVLWSLWGWCLQFPDRRSYLELEISLLGHKCCTLLCRCQDIPDGCCWCLACPGAWESEEYFLWTIVLIFSFRSLLLTIKFRLKFSKAASREMCIKLDTQAWCVHNLESTMWLLESLVWHPTICCRLSRNTSEPSSSDLDASWKGEQRDQVCPGQQFLLISHQQNNNGAETLQESGKWISQEFWNFQ